MKKTTLTWVFLMGLGIAGSAQAADALGIPVYQGATAQPGSAKMITDMIAGAKAFCYSTSDSVDKVVAYYKQQGLQYIGGDNIGSLLRKGDIDVSVEKSWIDPVTGATHNSTMFCIVQPPE